MGYNDRTYAQSKRRVIVTAVDIPNKRCGVMDPQFGSMVVRYDVGHGPIAMVPAVGQEWLVEKIGNDWFFYERTSTRNPAFAEALKEGDAIWATEGRVIIRSSIGDTVIGDGAVPSIPDPSSVSKDVPKPPTGLSASLEASQDKGYTNVRLKWSKASKSTAETDLRDPIETQIYINRPSVSRPWYHDSSTSGEEYVIQRIPSGEVFQVMLRTKSADGVYSVWTPIFDVDTSTGRGSAPKVPSNPIMNSRLGTVSVTWNGNSNDGAPYNKNFDHIDVYVGTDKNSSSPRYTMFGPTTTAFDEFSANSTIYAKFRAVDIFGRTSDWTPISQVRLEDLVDSGKINDAINKAKSELQDDIKEVNDAQIQGANDLKSLEKILGATDTANATPQSIASVIQSFVKVPLNNLVVADGGVFDVAVANQMFTNIFTANKITAKQLFVGSANNLIPNGFGEAGDNTFFSGAQVVPKGSLSQDSGSTVGLSFSQATSSDGWIYVDSGVEYLFSLEANSGTNTHAPFSVMFTDGSSNVYGGISDYTSENTNTWDRYSHSVTFPAGVSRVKLNVKCDSGPISLASLLLQKKVSGTLIQDGSITTEKIGADAVTADTLHVTDDMWAKFAQFVKIKTEMLEANAVTADKADLGSIAAQMIQSGVFTTAPSGQRVTVTSNGLIMYGTDPDGNDYEMVRLGPNGVNLLTIGNTTISPDGMVSDDADFGSLSVGGMDFFDAVDKEIATRSPRMVAIGGAGQSSSNIGLAANSETGVFDVLVPNVNPNHWYRAEIEFFTYPKGSDGEMSLRLRHSPVDQGVNLNSPTVAGPKRIGSLSGTKWDYRHVTFWFQGSQMNLISKGKTGRLLLTAISSSTIELTPDVTMAVYTEAQYVPFTQTLNRGGAPVPGSTTTTTTPANSSVQTQTIDWWNNGSTTYFVSNNAVYSDSPDAIQGSYNGTNSARRYTCWWFDDLTSRLSGATINDVQIYVRNTHTYASVGGTGHFYAHNGANNAGSNIMNASFQRGQERWLSIPIDYWNQLKTGAFKGFMCYTTSSSTNEYMRFAGGGMSACIRITYTK